MIKTLKTMSKQEKERYTVPRKVQDVIPVRRIWPDGIFLILTIWWQAARIRRVCSSSTRNFSIPWIPGR